MTHPPDPETNRGAAGNDTPNSKPLLSTHDNKPETLEFQAHKLRGLYSFCRATAYTVASLAWGVAR